MPARRNLRRTSRWNKTIWLMHWTLRGRPQQLELLDLVTIPEEAFEHHNLFYAGDPEHPVATIRRYVCKSWPLGPRGYPRRKEVPTVSVSYEANPRRSLRSFRVSSASSSQASLARACLGLCLALQHRGLPAWYLKRAHARAARPDYYARRKRKRPEG